MRAMPFFRSFVFALVLLMLLIPSWGVGALGPFTDSWKEPVDTLVYNPCNDEWIWLTGNMHILYHDNLTPSGRLKWETRISYDDVAGYGMTSDKTYVGVGVDQGGGSTLIEGAQGPYHYQASSQHTMSLIGKGNTENYRVHMNFHITVTPGFETTTFVENFQFECN